MGKREFTRTIIRAAVSSYYNFVSLPSPSPLALHHPYPSPGSFNFRMNIVLFFFPFRSGRSGGDLGPWDARPWSPIRLYVYDDDDDETRWYFVKVHYLVLTVETGWKKTTFLHQYRRRLIIRYIRKRTTQMLKLFAKKLRTIKRLSILRAHTQNSSKRGSETKDVVFFFFCLSSRVSYYFDNYRIVTVIRGEKYDISNLSYFAVYVVRNEYDVGPGDEHRCVFAIAANSKNLTFTKKIWKPVFTRDRFKVTKTVYI